MCLLGELVTVKITVFLPGRSLCPDEALVLKQLELCSVNVISAVSYSLLVDNVAEVGFYDSAESSVGNVYATFNTVSYVDSLSLPTAEFPLLAHVHLFVCTSVFITHLNFTIYTQITQNFTDNPQTFKQLSYPLHYCIFLLWSTTYKIYTFYTFLHVKPLLRFCNLSLHFSSWKNGNSVALRPQALQPLTL